MILDRCESNVQRSASSLYADGGKRRTNRCWRLLSMQDVIFFFGHHEHEFIEHAHDIATLVLVTAGSVEIKIGAEWRRAVAGELFFVAAHQVHSARPLELGYWEMRTMHFPAECIARTAGGNGVQPPIAKGPDSELARAFLTFHVSLETAGANQQMSLFRDFMNMFSAGTVLENGKRKAERCVDDRLVRARQLIEKRVFQNVPMEDIAEEARIPIFSLIRCFKREYGTSPHVWRMQARANAAAKSLREKVPLVEAAISCGFYDQSHMTRVFSKVFGVTPGQYRLMY